MLLKYHSPIVQMNGLNGFVNCWQFSFSKLKSSKSKVLKFGSSLIDDNPERWQFTIIFQYSWLLKSNNKFLHRILVLVNCAFNLWTLILDPWQWMLPNCVYKLELHRNLQMNHFRGSPVPAEPASPFKRSNVNHDLDFEGRAKNAGSIGSGRSQGGRRQANVRSLINAFSRIPSGLRSLGRDPWPK